MAARNPHEHCDTCPCLPQHDGRPVRYRIVGVDDWGKNHGGKNDAADGVRQWRHRAWESAHVR